MSASLLGFPVPIEDGCLEFVVEPIAALDGYYIESAMKLWLSDPTDDEINGIICHAYCGNWEVGKLALDAAGKVLIVEVEPDWRRRGIATEMYAALVDAGYDVIHDWDNLRPDGEAWVRSLEATKGGEKHA